MTNLQVATAAVIDAGRVKVGAGMRLPPVRIATADTGRVKVGAGMRLLAR